MGNEESTAWDRYVPPGMEENNDKQRAQTNSNKTDDKTKQQPKTNTNDDKAKQKTKTDGGGKEQPQAKTNKPDTKGKEQKPNKTDAKSNAGAKEKPQAKTNKNDAKPNSDVKEQPKPKPNKAETKSSPVDKDQARAKPHKNDEKEKNKPKTAKEKEKQDNSKKNKKKKEEDNASDTENVDETSAKHEGLRRPQMIRGGHGDYSDDLEYDPMSNFLERTDLDKEWGSVTDNYIDPVFSQAMVRKKPLGPRWKPKTPVRTEPEPDAKHVGVPGRDNAKHIPGPDTERIVGPVRKPQMKVGNLECMMDKSHKFSLHGNFVLDPVKSNGNFMT